MAANRRDSAEPLIEANSLTKSYYESLESRIGYRFLLGGTRHHGYYEKDTFWPFPIGKALRAMEEKLFLALNLPEGSQVLDAGCGVAHVALYMARRGLRVTGIDLLHYHLAKARRNIARAGLLPGQVTVQKMDYHHLESIPDQSHDGVYTMETFVHAADPETVLAGFYRILRPGGRVVLHEYAFEKEHAPEAAARAIRLVNKYGSMPTGARSHPGVFKRMLEDAGFTDVRVEDYSQNVRPMLRLFFVLAVVPYFLVTLFGLERWFVNTVAGTRGYLDREHWRYVAVSATKPGGSIEAAKTK
jgi:ubiquinone/menaquinone biosynthesis C-methylase UbiE